MPHSAVLITDAITGALAFPIGFTYTGHPTACAVALANLNIMNHEGLLANAEDLGGHLARELRCPLDLPVVGDVRQIGLMIGIELVSDGTPAAPLPAGFAPSWPRCGKTPQSWYALTVTP